jgi:hypothetical protein
MRMITVISAFMVLLALSGTAQAALPLGSVTGATNAKASPGDKAEFYVLFFNSHGGEDVLLSFDSEGPEGWDTALSSSRFDLTYHEPGDCTYDPDYECLGTGAGDVMARKLRLSVFVPSDAEPGQHSVDLTAWLGSDKGTMSVQQMRTFTFTVDVMGDEDEDEDEEEPEEQPGQDEGSNDSRNEQDGKDDALTFADNNQSGSGGSDVPEVNEGQGPGQQPEDGLTGRAVATGVSWGMYVVIALAAVLISWKIYMKE